MNTQERIYFVSGHMDLTKEEFAKHYEQTILDAYRTGCSFVVGDAPGCDFMAQRLLYKLETGKNKTSGRVIIFHMKDCPRHSFGSGWGSNDPNLNKDIFSGPRGGFCLKGGFTSDKERDEAMTAASTHDIAWVRPYDKSKKIVEQQKILLDENFTKKKNINCFKQLGPNLSLLITGTIKVNGVLLVLKNQVLLILAYLFLQMLQLDLNKQLTN